MSLPPGLLPIAHQLHAALLVQIDHEIEIERLVSDGRYARDVLLVCDACPGTNLPGLAAQWRSLPQASLPTLSDEHLPAHARSAPMDLAALQAAPAAGSAFGPADADTRPGLPPARPRPPPPAATAVSRLLRWWAGWRRY